MREGKENIGTCQACGLSPVNHTATYLSASFDAWMNDSTMRFQQTSAYALLERILDRPLTWTLSSFLSLLRTFQLSGISHDPERARTYRSQVVWEEALHRGIPMEQLTLFATPLELYRARIGRSWQYFQSIPVPPAKKRLEYKGLDDKFLFKKRIREAGLPAPEAVCVRNLAEARLAFEKLQKPVVVKPRMGSRARHTTTRVSSLEDLDMAYERARVLCRQVIVEEFLEGGVCRATIVEGRLVGFLQMLPARVMGDGVYSVRELVDIKNASRPERVAEVELDPEHAEFLARLGYTFDSILPKELTIDLSRRTGRFEGGETRELPNEVHPKLRAYVERAAAALASSVIGLDLIIPDPTADPDTQRWGLLEGNSVPFIDLHYWPLHGQPSNVASAVWDLWGSALSA